MSDLDSLVGQMFIVGLGGLEIGADFKEFYRRCPAGGFILFRRNVADPGQLKALTLGLRDCALERHAGYGEPVICADQEGGSLSPLREFVSSMPGNMGLAATGDPEAARYAGYVTGRDLSGMGLNLNLAPVLDLAGDPVNQVVSVRAFSDDPDVVAEFGCAYATGLEQSGTLFAAKHFPGHGSVAEDSHVTLPVSRATREELLAADLIPFSAIARLSNPAVMATHIIFSELDPDLPASLSGIILTGLLRREMGYDGVVLTDCLEMDGARKVGPVSEVAVLAVEAGCDLLLVSHTPELQAAAFEAVRNAVRSGRISVGRIEQSVERIARWKAQADSRLDPKVRFALDPESLGEKVATFMPGETEWRFGADTIVLAVPHMERLTPAEDLSDLSALGDEIRRVGLGCVTISCSMNPGPEEIEEVVAEIRQTTYEDTGVVLVVRNSGDAPGQAALAAAIQSVRNLLLVSVREPRETRTIQQALAARAPVLFTYSAERVALSAVARILAGMTVPKGVLPVSL